MGVYKVLVYPFSHRLCRGLNQERKGKQYHIEKHTTKLNSRSLGLTELNVKTTLHERTFHKMIISFLKRRIPAKKSTHSLDANGHHAKQFGVNLKADPPPLRPIRTTFFCTRTESALSCSRLLSLAYPGSRGGRPSCRQPNKKPLHTTVRFPIVHARYTWSIAPLSQRSWVGIAAA